MLLGNSSGIAHSSEFNYSLYENIILSPIIMYNKYVTLLIKSGLLLLLSIIIPHTTMKKEKRRHTTGARRAPDNIYNNKYIYNRLLKEIFKN